MSQRTVLIAYHFPSEDSPFSASDLLGAWKPIPRTTASHFTTAADAHPVLRDPGGHDEEYRLVLVRIGVDADAHEVSFVNGWIRDTIQSNGPALLFLHEKPWQFGNRPSFANHNHTIVVTDQTQLYSSAGSFSWQSWLDMRQIVKLHEVWSALDQTWTVVYNKGILSNVFFALAVIHLALQCRLDITVRPAYPRAYEICRLGDAVPEGLFTDGPSAVEWRSLTVARPSAPALSRQYSVLSEELVCLCSTIHLQLPAFLRRASDDHSIAQGVREVAAGLNTGARAFTYVAGNQKSDVSGSEFLSTLNNIASNPGFVLNSVEDSFEKCKVAIAGIEWFADTFGSLYSGGSD